MEKIPDADMLKKVRDMKATQGHRVESFIEFREKFHKFVEQRGTKTQHPTPELHPRTETFRLFYGSKESSLNE